MPRIPTRSSTPLASSFEEQLDSDLQVPIIVDSRNTVYTPKRTSCYAILKWPYKVLATVVGNVGIVLKLLLLVVRLLLYSLLLMPGFVRMITYYFFSNNVVRGILYGGKPRQRLDMYFPLGACSGRTYPVVIYVTGGAWTIGYKAWGALLARRLSEQGVLVACLDYRNFPQGDALDMLEDVNTGISWVLARIHRFGGDPDSVTLVGQSAGGHLAGLALIKQAEQAAASRPTLGASPPWAPSRLRAFVGVSGAFDLEALAAHRGGHFRGLLDRILALEEVEEVEAEGEEEKELDLGRECRQGEGEGTAIQVKQEDHTVTLVEVVAGRAEGQSGGEPGDFQEVGVAAGEGVEQQQEQQRDAAIAVGSVSMRGTEVRGDRPGATAGPRGGTVRWRRATSTQLPPLPTPPAQRKRPAYDILSPLQAARRLPADAASLLPYILLIHGTADKTVPHEGSVRLCEALQTAGAPSCRHLLVPGKTHTAFLLEDPMRGGRDLLMDTVLGAVMGSGNRGDVEQGTGRRPAITGSARTGDVGGGGGDRSGGGGEHVYRSLCPGILCDLAGWVCPF